MIGSDYSPVDRSEHKAHRLRTGQGATAPWTMDEAGGYLSGRANMRLGTHYNAAGIPTATLRNYASSSIKDQDTPSIIGTGWLTHYPLAWGYAWRERFIRIAGNWVSVEVSRVFYVNQGWGGNSDGYIPAVTWFVGDIRPH